VTAQDVVGVACCALILAGVCSVLAALIADAWHGDTDARLTLAIIAALLVCGGALWGLVGWES